MSEKDLGKVIAIQIAPFEELENGSIEVQFDGANADTDGYGVYLRHENGMAIHSKDCKTEADAIKLARELCKDRRVFVEPYQWQIGIVHMAVAEPSTKESRRRAIQHAIDLYVTDETFNISLDDPDRQKKIAGLKVELCSYLLESGIPDEEKTVSIADLLASREVASKLVDEANAKPTTDNISIREETIWHRGKVTGISVSYPVRIVVDYDGFIQSHTGDLVERIVSFLKFGDVIEVDNKEKPTQIRLATKQ